MPILPLSETDRIVIGMAINFAMDIITQTSGRKVTLDNLDQVIQDEEIRSATLEAARREALRRSLDQAHPDEQAPPE